MLHPDDLPRAVGPRGRYRLLERTSDDRLGSVWSATDQAMGRAVTIRLLPGTARQPARAGALHAALRTAFPRFRDPYAVATLAFHVLGERHPFVVMEPLNGPTLAERLAEPIGLREIERIAVVREVGGCLAAAHRAGVTHGALSPDSVVLIHGRAKVMDWGLWPLVVDRLDADPSRADDVGSLASITTAMGCTLDAESGFPAELLQLIPRERRPTPLRVGRRVGRPAEAVAPPRLATHRPPTADEDVIDLTADEADAADQVDQVDQADQADGSNEVLSLPPSPPVEGFSRPPASERHPATRVLRREETPAAPSPRPARPGPNVEREPAAAAEAPTVSRPAPTDARAFASALRQARPTPRDRLRERGVAIARTAVVVIAGLIVLGLIWRVGTGAEPSRTTTTTTTPTTTPSASSPATAAEGTTVPDVLGKRVNAAEARLEAAGLTVSHVVTLGDGRTVSRTDPTPGEAVVVATDVVVYVGEDAPSD